MSEWTPETEDLRTAYRYFCDPEYRNHDAQEMWIRKNDAEFDRWLARERADAAAQALEDTARSYVYVFAVTNHLSKVAAWLRERAARYRKEQTRAE